LYVRLLKFDAVVGKHLIGRQLITEFTTGFLLFAF